MLEHLVRHTAQGITVISRSQTCGSDGSNRGSWRRVDGRGGTHENDSGNQVAANWELTIFGCLQGLEEQRVMMQKVAGKENPADALIITLLLNCVIRSEK